MMNFRISRIHRVAGGRVTPGALGGHRHPAGMIGTGMIILKRAMAGRAIATAIMATYRPPIFTIGNANEPTINAMA